MNEMKALEKKMIEKKQSLFTSEEFIQFLENEFEVSHLKKFNPKAPNLLPFRCVTHICQKIYYFEFYVS